MTQGGCRKHRVECTYDRLTRALPIIPSPAPEPTVNQSNAVSFNQETESRERRYRELRLLHVFLANICPHTSGTHLPVLHKTWTNKVPQLALEHESLLNAIMALSCLYLLVEAKDDDAELQLHRANYLEATVQQHRENLADMTESNADAACFVSVLLTMDAFASLRSRPLEPYEPPLHWLQMSRGLAGVFKQALRLLKNHPDATMRPLVDTTLLYVKPDVVFCKTNREGLEHLLEFQEGEIEGEDDVNAYQKLVSFIGSVILARRAGEDPKMISRRLTSFAVLVPPRFIGLLRLQRPRALILLAHYFALANCIAYTWWIGPSPGREVRAIQAQLGDEWQALMSWPMKELENQHYRGPDEK
ncbi:c6 zinc finger domain [Fusarium albosuccineum]|uniref:C6 zinc finger domain n=1 Tax=Fusarium albosuccineum TaxID=1237068 RepID=A0A8H4PIL1_9HYPO|nr:c6 zinc finger domain [Fusarium albosuccineum]